MKKILTHLIWFLALLTPKAQSSELIEFHEFPRLPLVLQIHIFSYVDKPGNTYLVSKIHKGEMQKSFLWARPNIELARFVDEAFDNENNVKLDAPIFRELNKSSGLILIRRLLWFSAALEGEAAKARVRTILTRQIADKLFFYKDVLIEINRNYPSLAESAMHLARGDTAYGVPMVHSAQMPKYFQDRIQQAEVVEALVNDDGIYRIWRLSSWPELNCLTTVGIPGHEEYVVSNLIEIDGRIPADGIQVLYHDNTMRDWPLKQEPVEPAAIEK